MGNPELYGSIQLVPYHPYDNKAQDHVNHVHDLQDVLYMGIA